MKCGDHRGGTVTPMRKAWLAGVCFALGALGCSDPNDETAASVAGKWCGREVTAAELCVGDEVEYLELEQSGSVVTGQICEAFEKDCAPIEDGKVSGSKLTFGFSPTTVGGRVDLELSGDVMEGAIQSEKCACDVPFTFHRL